MAFVDSCTKKIVLCLIALRNLDCSFVNQFRELDVEVESGQSHIDTIHHSLTCVQACRTVRRLCSTARASRTSTVSRLDGHFELTYIVNYWHGIYLSCFDCNIFIFLSGDHGDLKFHIKAQVCQ